MAKKSRSGRTKWVIFYCQGSLVGIISCYASMEDFHVLLCLLVKKALFADRLAGLKVN